MGLENFVWTNIQSFAIWGAIASISAFFMQRLHYENPEMRGAVLPGPKILSYAARGMMWALYACCLYVGFRLNWLPAIVCALIFLIVPIIVSTVQMLIARISTGILTLISTPIGVVSFAAALFALRHV
jgi:hypothetical protein